MEIPLRAALVKFKVEARSPLLAGRQASRRGSVPSRGMSAAVGRRRMHSGTATPARHAGPWPAASSAVAADSRARAGSPDGPLSTRSL